jgi:hypothetical protein
VVAGAALIALLSGVGIWTAVGGVALVCFAVSTAWKGQSVSTRTALSAVLAVRQGQEVRERYAGAVATT